MKKLFFIAVAALTFALTGCEKNPTISIDESQFLVPAAGGEYLVNLTCNTTWTAEISVASTAQVTVEPEFGSGNAQVKLTVAENLSENPLAAVIRFSAGVAPKAVFAEVSLNQAGLTSVSWGGVDYKVKKLADGNIWFVENLRYVPEGKSVTADLTALDNGVWYPVDAKNKTLTDNADTVAKKGYLYSAEAALGVAAGTVNNNNFTTFEGARGICPEGWHIPTLDEIAHLVGRVAVSKYDLKQTPGPVAEAPYWDKEKAASQTTLANADGFNLDNKNGHVSFNNSTKKVLVQNAFSYYLTSTAVPKSADPSVFNDQFYAIMPMATGTCNGAAFNHKGGAAVRCIKTKLLK